MIFVFLITIVLTAWLALRGSTPLRSRLFELRLPPYVFFAAATVLPLTLWVQLRLAAIEAAHDALHDPWAAALPIPIAFDFDAWRLTSWLTVPFATFACVVAGSVALFVLCSAPVVSAARRGALACCGLTLAAIAISSGVLTSSDVYMYLFAAVAGHAIYSPPHDLFGSANVIMDRHIALRGALYGPAWIAINGAIVSLGHTEGQKIIVLRAFNALLVVACGYALRYAGASRRAGLAFVLNPMLWFYAVVNAHNDIIAIFPCLVAICVAGRSRIAAIALVAFAGCVKLPFLLLGILAFAPRGGRGRDVRSAVVTIALCLAVSWIFGGSHYLLDILGFVHAKNASGNALVHAFGACATIVALGFVAFAFATGRFFAGAALTMANLSPFVFPGYVLWALPYAVLTGRGLTLTLAAMPLAAFMLDDVYALHEAGAVAFVLVAVLCGFDALRVPRTRPIGT